MRPQSQFAEPGASAIFVASRPSSARPIDLVHLARQTLGDRTLELEVLGLMKRQIDHCADRVELATHCERGPIAHALRSAALNIGAFPLAERAQRLEDQPDDEQAKRLFVHEMARTAAFIDTLLPG